MRPQVELGDEWQWGASSMAGDEEWCCAFAHNDLLAPHEESGPMKGNSGPRENFLIQAICRYARRQNRSDLASIFIPRA